MKYGNKVRGWAPNNHNVGSTDRNDWLFCPPQETEAKAVPPDAKVGVEKLAVYQRGDKTPPPEGWARARRFITQPFSRSPDQTEMYLHWKVYQQAITSRQRPFSKDAQLEETAITGQHLVFRRWRRPDVLWLCRTEECAICEGSFLWNQAAGLAKNPPSIAPAWLMGKGPQYHEAVASGERLTSLQN